MERSKSDLRFVVVGAFVIMLAFAFVAAMIRSRVHIDHFDVRQKAQMHSMDAAIELFNQELNAYPPSDANDPTGKAYCGAMKLAEALMGRDVLGFHSQSVFRRDGLDATGINRLYPSLLSPDNLRARRGPYLAVETSRACRLEEIYGSGKTGPFSGETYVLCDTFEQKRPSGSKTGMPILYYRANRLGHAHQPGDPNNIYDCADNRALIALGVPGQPGKTHPLLDPKRFYLNTRNHMIKTASQPYRADSYILVSAGWDGLYGTADDICNFNWKYRQQ